MIPPLKAESICILTFWIEKKYHEASHWIHREIGESGAMPKTELESTLSNCKCKTEISTANWSKSENTVISPYQINF